MNNLCLCKDLAKILKMGTIMFKLLLFRLNDGSFLLNDFKKSPKIFEKNEEKDLSKAP